MSKKKKGKKQKQKQKQENPADGTGFKNPLKSLAPLPEDTKQEQPTLPKDPAAEQPQGNKDGVDLIADGTEPKKKKAEPAKDNNDGDGDTIIYTCVSCNFETRYKSQALIVNKPGSTEKIILCPRCHLELIERH